MLNFVQNAKMISSSGQPSEDQFKELADNGVNAVVNLAMPDHPDSISNEGEIVTSLGMKYFHIPVNFKQPLEEDVLLFCKLMSALKDEKVHCHCIANFRISAFLYHYFTKVLELDDQESRSPIFEEWDIDPIWEEMLEWTEEDIGL